MVRDLEDLPNPPPDSRFCPTLAYLKMLMPLVMTAEQYFGLVD